jgi:hypothetical protein
MVALRGTVDIRVFSIVPRRAAGLRLSAIRAPGGKMDIPSLTCTARSVASSEISHMGIKQANAGKPIVR